MRRKTTVMIVLLMLVLVGASFLQLVVLAR